MSARWHTIAMDAENPPDLFTDTIGIAAGPFGFTLTLRLSDPETVTAENPGRVVGHVRMSPELAGALADILHRAVVEHRKATQKPSQKGG